MSEEKRADRLNEPKAGDPSLETHALSESLKAGDPQATDPQSAEPKENILLSLLLNILIPSMVLFKLSAPTRLGPVWALILALSFPISYGVIDLIRRKKINWISLLGLVSLLLTGAIGLVALDAHWLALKEALVPMLIGIAGVVSIRTHRPLVRLMVYNDKVIKTEKVDEALNQHNRVRSFDRLLVHATLMLSGSFFLSAILNYVLTRIIVVSAAGTPEFNAEVGRMMMLSYPVIVVPSMIITMLTLWFLLSGIKRLTQLELEEIFNVG